MILTGELGSQTLQPLQAPPLPVEAGFTRPRALQPIGVKKRKFHAG